MHDNISVFHFTVYVKQLSLSVYWKTFYLIIPFQVMNSFAGSKMYLDRVQKISWIQVVHISRGKTQWFYSKNMDQRGMEEYLNDINNDKWCCDLLRIQNVVKWHLYAVLIFKLLSFPAKKYVFSFIRKKL